MDFSAIKNNLVGHRQKAEEQILYIKMHPDLPTEELHERIYDYVLFKYNLYGEVQDVYKLSDLAELSVAKTLRMSKEQAVAADLQTSCDGATSAMKKKVLLLMAVQKELEIKFPLDKTAKIQDTHFLADIVGEQLKSKAAAVYA